MGYLRSMKNKFGLIVWDDPATLNFIRAMCKGQGINLVTAIFDPKHPYMEPLSVNSWDQQAYINTTR